MHTLTHTPRKIPTTLTLTVGVIVQTQMLHQRMARPLELPTPPTGHLCANLERTVARQVVHRGTWEDG